MAKSTPIGASLKIIASAAVVLHKSNVLYLGEINDSPREAWWRSIEILEHWKKRPWEISLFPEDRKVQSNNHDVIHVRANQMRLQRPRQWGACWKRNRRSAW
jgi:hypothetical protein